MRARDIAEPYPVVGFETPALEAARLIARDRLPGLLVTGPDGTPKAVLPASEHPATVLLVLLLLLLCLRLEVYCSTMNGALWAICCLETPSFTLMVT